MTARLSELVLSLMLLLLAAALEELLPRFGSVGFPLLLAAGVFLALRPSPLTLGWALAAGAAEEALSNLAPVSGAAFFLAAAALARRSGRPRLVVVVAAGLFQLWQALFAMPTAGELCLRLLLAPVLAAVAALAVWLLASPWERKVVADVG